MMGGGSNEGKKELEDEEKLPSSSRLINLTDIY